MMFSQPHHDGHAVTFKREMLAVSSLVEVFMKKLLAIMAPLALGVCFCGMLQADDSAPPVAGSGDIYQANNSYTWFVEHNAAIAKDADATGVDAVVTAAALLREKEPQVQIDFFTKALQDCKSRPVQRQIRMALIQVYRLSGQSDMALDECHDLMMDQ
jgi:hypothetical protein